jgi:hypothetical protein
MLNSHLRVNVSGGCRCQSVLASFLLSQRTNANNVFIFTVQQQRGGVPAAGGPGAAGQAPAQGLSPGAASALGSHPMMAELRQVG